MGCYGIGPGRVLASIIEQNNDENGMILPMEIAPYKVSIVVVNKDDEAQMKVAEEIYNNLNEEKIDVMLDDRDERPGVKFKDMDLIGIPVRITVGKKVNENMVEFKLRKESEIELVEINNVIEKVKATIK